MTLNKYNEFMSHIRVDDEMHRRIMKAVSDAVNEDGSVKNNNPEDKFVIKADVEPLSSAASGSAPVKRKAKVSVIRILSIAAVTVLVAGGAVFFATRFMGSQTTKSANMAMDTAAETAINQEIDSALDGRYAGNSNSANKAALTAGKKTEEETTADAEEKDGVQAVAPGASKENINEREADAKKKTTYAIPDLKPYFKFSVKTVGRSTLAKDIKVTVYTGDNGEKALVFEANEGTDIVKAYYPDFKGTPAQLKTSGGQSFTAIDTSVSGNETVSTTGPFDAVTWTKNGKTYMIAFGQKTDLDEFLTVMDKI